MNDFYHYSMLARLTNPIEKANDGRLQASPISTGKGRSAVATVSFEYFMHGGLATAIGRFLLLLN